MTMAINAGRINDHGAHIKEKRRGLPDMVINAGRINDHCARIRGKKKLFGGKQKDQSDKNKDHQKTIDHEKDDKHNLIIAQSALSSWWRGICCCQW